MPLVFAFIVGIKKSGWPPVPEQHLQSRRHDEAAFAVLAPRLPYRERSGGHRALAVIGEQRSGNAGRRTAKHGERGTSGRASRAEGPAAGAKSAEGGTTEAMKRRGTVAAKRCKRWLG